MTYKLNNWIDELLTDVDTIGATEIHHNKGNFSINTKEDYSKEILVNVAGHNPKDVDVNVTENEIHIKSNTEVLNAVTSDVNLKFTVGNEYDGTTSKASIENGILTILLDKRDEKKGKKLSIKY